MTLPWSACAVPAHVSDEVDVRRDDRAGRVLAVEGDEALVAGVDGVAVGRNRVGEHGRRAEEQAYEGERCRPSEPLRFHLSSPSP